MIDENVVQWWPLSDISDGLRAKVPFVTRSCLACMSFLLSGDSKMKVNFVLHHFGIPKVRSINIRRGEWKQIFFRSPRFGENVSFDCFSLFEAVPATKRANLHVQSARRRLVPTGVRSSTHLNLWSRRRDTRESSRLNTAERALGKIKADNETNDYNFFQAPLWVHACWLHFELIADSCSANSPAIICQFNLRHEDKSSLAESTGAFCYTFVSPLSAI